MPTAPHVPARTLNKALEAGTARARELEPKLEAILVKVLDRAADEAARQFELMATDPLTAAAPEPTSTMIALYPRPEEAERLAAEEGEPADILHVTLAYLGETTGSLQPIVEALRPVAAGHPPLEGVVGGIGSFDDYGDGHPSIALPDVPGLVELRVAVTEALAHAELDYGRDHGFTAHVTLDYTAEPTFSVDAIGQELHFDELVVVRGDTERVRLPLHGPPSITAAGKPTPANWIAPTPDELIDVDEVVGQLRGKTDPVRRAMVEATMTPGLEAAGLDWDVTNPFTARVLAQSASQVTHIAETTRSNVRRTIAASYEQGLSIPDTAKAIRAGMKEANAGRARLIARTELAGAVNGGSLAATEIVSAATGTTYWKTWLTAGGAKHPRHETYNDLDGQTVALDDTFTVGGDELEYPGDPNGDPAEVCNCRCTMEYTEEPPDAATAPSTTDELGLAEGEAEIEGEPSDTQEFADRHGFTAAEAATWASGTPMQVEQLANATFPTVDFKLRKLSATAARGIAHQTGELLDRYPDVKLKAVYTKRDKKNLLGMSQESDQAVWFNERYYSSGRIAAADLDQIMMTSLSTDWFPITYGVTEAEWARGIAAHEFAHRLHHTILPDLSRDWTDLPPGRTGEIIKQWKQIPTTYGKTNPREAFAEVFQMTMAEGTRYATVLNTAQRRAVDGMRELLQLHGQWVPPRP